jgi:hypothetical protein
VLQYYFAWIPTLVSLDSLNKKESRIFNRDFSDINFGHNNSKCEIEYDNEKVKMITVSNKNSQFNFILEIKNLDLETGNVIFYIKHYDKLKDSFIELTRDFVKSSSKYKIIINNVLYVLLKEEYHTHLHHSKEDNGKFADNLLEVYPIDSKNFDEKFYSYVVENYIKKASLYLENATKLFVKNGNELLANNNLKALLRGMGEMSFALSYISLIAHYKKPELLDIQSKRIAIESCLRSMQVVYNRQKLELINKEKKC